MQQVIFFYLVSKSAHDNKLSATHIYCKYSQLLSERYKSTIYTILKTIWLPKLKDGQALNCYETDDQILPTSLIVIFITDHHHLIKYSRQILSVLKTYKLKHSFLTVFM